jgi:hypothetical protein
MKLPKVRVGIEITAPADTKIKAPADIKIEKQADTKIELPKPRISIGG